MTQDYSNPPTASSTPPGSPTEVLNTAGQEAGALASEAVEQARDLLQEARHQLREVTIEERNRLEGALERFTDELQTMRMAGTGGYATQLADMVLMRTRSVQDSLRERPPEDLVDGVQRFARLKPGMFLAGALVLGFTVGRVTRTAAMAASAKATAAPTNTGAGVNTSAGMHTSVDATREWMPDAS